MKVIDIIIPIYRPDEKLFALIGCLEHQTAPVNKIILINTEQKYFDSLIHGKLFFEKYPNVEVFHILKEEFNHGSTRNYGVGKSKADIFVFMTQDALPEDEHLIEQLIKPLEKEKVAIVYGRQLPTEGSGLMERFNRAFNYPEISIEKGAEDIERLGIKTFFCSNVCAAYKRDVFDSLGGFCGHTIFNEDMLYAAGAVRAGYRITYNAEARVVHSHNYTCSQQFHRNFDLGVSQAEHPEVFASVPSEKEGMLLLKRMTAYLWKKRKRLIPKCFLNSFCRYAGFFLGKHYRILPMFVIMKCTMSKEYWTQNKE